VDGPIFGLAAQAYNGERETEERERGKGRMREKKYHFEIALRKMHRHPLPWPDLKDSPSLPPTNPLIFSK
jgi:hypothetical protein